MKVSNQEQHGHREQNRHSGRYRRTVATALFSSVIVGTVLAGNLFIIEDPFCILFQTESRWYRCRIAFLMFGNLQWVSHHGMGGEECLTVID